MFTVALTIVVSAFALETDLFTISFPDKPTKDSTKVPTAAGEIVMTSWSLEQGDRSYTVVTADYPADLVSKTLPMKVLEGARDGLIANVNAKLDKDYATYVDSGMPKRKWPALDLFATASDLRLSARLVLAGHTMVQVMTSQPKSDTSDDHFQSFASTLTFKPRADDPPPPPAKEPQLAPKPKVEHEVFEVTFSARPQIDTQTVTTANGEVQFTSWMLESAGTACLVSLARVGSATNDDKRDDQTKLENARDGSVANVNGTLGESRRITAMRGAAKVQGLEFTAKNTAQGMQVMSRLYLVDRDLLQVMVVVPAGAPLEKTFATFAATLKLKGAAKIKAAPKN